MSTNSHEDNLANRPTVVVANLFGDINRGGAAITAETIKMLQATGARVVGVAVHDRPSKETHEHTIKAFPDVLLVGTGLAVTPGPLSGTRRTIKSLYWLVFPKRADSLACRTIIASDLVVSKGGYVFVDRSSVSALMAMWSTTFPLIFARRVGTPTIAFPTSAGPQTHIGSTLLTKWLISGMTAFFARDPLSAATARALVNDVGNVVEVPDIVLGMDPPDRQSVEAMCDRYRITVDTFATITVRLPGTAEGRLLLDAVANSARVLAADPRVTHIVLIDQAEDYEATQALAHEIRDLPNVIVVKESLSPSELIALYAGSRLTVAGRLHAAIFSFVAGTPAIAISVDPLKAEGVYESLGMPSEWVVPLREMDRLPQTVAMALAMTKVDREEIRSAVSRVARKLDVVRRAVASAISSPAGS